MSSAPLVSEVYGLPPVRSSTRSNQRLPSPTPTSTQTPPSSQGLSQGVNNVVQAISSVVAPMTSGVAGVPRSLPKASTGVEENTVASATNVRPGTTVADLVTETSINQMIVRSGLTPLGTIIVSDGKDLRPVYIRVATPTGQQALVELDAEGVVETSQGDMTLVPTVKSPIISHSIKSGALSEVNQAVSGVAVVCKDRVCVVTRDDHMKPVETSFIVPEKSELESLKPPKESVTLPMVKLSEVIADAKSVRLIIEEAFPRFFNTAYKMHLEEFKTMKHGVKDITDALNDFEKIQEEAVRELLKSIDELHKVLRMYSLEKQESYPERYDQLTYNLVRRYEMYIDLMETIQRIVRKRAKLERTAKSIVASAKYIREEFKYVRGVLKP